MSSVINRVVLVGHLTRNPELLHTQGGTAVAQFGIAVNEREKDPSTEEWIDRPSFFEVVAWGHQAEFADQYLSKGSLVGVEGRLRQDRWEKEGERRSMVKITATNLQSFKRAGEEADAGAPDDDLPFQPAAAAAGGAPDDDIPF